MIVIAAIVWMAAAVCAEEANETKAKGLDAITDAAGAVVTKAGALLTGKLEVTMPTDKDRYADKNNYSVNAMGEKVPKSTLLKSGKR